MRVKVSLTLGFWLADTCCTQALWHAITATNPSKFQDDEVLSRELPVESITFDEVQEFITKLNKRFDNKSTFALPSEEQWEYACRAGTPTRYSCGETISNQQANFYDKSSEVKTEKETQWSSSRSLEIRGGSIKCMVMYGSGAQIHTIITSLIHDRHG